MNNSDRLQQQNNHNRDSESMSNSILAVKWSCRWDVFRRLKALDIECQCSTNEPLLVNLHSPVTVVQVWSVLKQTNASRNELIDWLNHCWKAV